MLRPLTDIILYFDHQAPVYKHREMERQRSQAALAYTTALNQGEIEASLLVLRPLKGAEFRQKHAASEQHEEVSWRSRSHRGLLSRKSPDRSKRAQSMETTSLKSLGPGGASSEQAERAEVLLAKKRVEVEQKIAERQVGLTVIRSNTAF
eukprot:SAG31_NODE_1090_length_9967_cov_66.880726_9_plen_150_part_00